MNYLIYYNGKAAFVEMLRDDSSDYYGAVQESFKASVGGAKDKYGFVAMIRYDGIERTDNDIPYTWALG